MTGDTEDVWDPREVARGRALNELFDAQRGAAEGEFGRSSFGSASRREKRECAGMLRDLGLAAGRLDALIAHGIFEKSEDDAYPARFGSYKVVAFLGRGGMGLVFKAFDEKLRRPIALKLLRPELCHEARTVARFTREAQAAARLNHPNIVGVYDVGEHAGVHYIAMEYVDGPSLAEAIKGCEISAVTQRSVIGDQEGGGADPAASAPRAGHSSGHTSASTNSFASTNSSAAAFSPAIDLRDTGVIRSVFRQLLQALAAAHEAGLIHRDVKSSNILLSIRTPSISAATPAEGGAADVEARIQNAEFHLTVKLADFGLARMADSQTRMTAAESIMGTPEYMSPEQARGDAEIDHRTDLYSAGVVLYEMLTGRTPFEAATPTGVIHLILNATPATPTEINPKADRALASVAQRLTAKDSRDRYQSSEAVLHDLDSSGPIASPRHRRRLIRRVAAVTATVFAVAAIGWIIAGFPPSAVPADDIRVEPGARRTIQIKQRESTIWRNKYWEVLESYDGLYSQALMLDVDGQGGTIIVIGLDQPHVVADLSRSPDSADHEVNMVAFDTEDNLVWGMYLRDEQDRIWPDCSATRYWQCAKLVAGDLDGNAGEELVAVATHPLEYPTRISVIDPVKGEVKPNSTFWHMGDVSEVWIQNKFFGDRAAIYATGTNNKLDGFGNPVPVGYAEKQYTYYSVVSVLMILDPADMHGLGPSAPHKIRDELSIVPAYPHAYAFLDLAANDGTHRVEPSTGEVCKPNSEERGVISVDDKPIMLKDGAEGPLLQLRIEDPENADAVIRAHLVVDRNLNIQDSAVLADDHSLTNKSKRLDCLKAWRAIVQDGRPNY